MKKWWVLGALLLVAGKGGAGRLAPGPKELEASASEAENRVARAEATGVAVVRLQNAWGELVATGKAPKKPCENEATRSLFARAAVFGPAWRDTAQAARAERDRLVEIAASPTVAPLIGDDMELRIYDVKQRVADMEVRYSEAVAWQRTSMTLTTACDLTLAASPGLASALPTAAGETLAVAVIGLGGGLVCPAGAPANGTPVVTEGTACVTNSKSCDCEPVPVAPAAVLEP